MADQHSGRVLASRYVTWGLLNLLVAGPTLGLLAAYDAATDGTLNLQLPIFSTHCWLTLMGFCVPMLLGIVFWLYPLLKESAVGPSHIPSLCLLFLVIPSFGHSAYLLLTYHGYPSLFVLPLTWGLYLVSGILYGLLIWRLTNRTLRPTATDLGIQAGAAWLLVVLAVRLVIALGALATGRHDFMAASDPAISIALLFGFVGNTGLAMAAAVTPPFLATPYPRALVMTSFRIYNLVLAIWCGGAAWILPHPFSWGRLPLALAGFALAYGVVRLLLDLRMIELLTLSTHGARRILVRTSMATAGIMMLLSAATIILISVWSGATMQRPPAEMLTMPMHLMSAGLLVDLVIALYVPVAGSRSLAGVKGVLAWTSYVLLTLWLLGKLGLTVVAAIDNTYLWVERYTVGWAAGLGMLLLGLWLVAALHGPKGKAAGR